MPVKDSGLVPHRGCDLSPRDLDILAGLAKGYTYHKIARLLSDKYYWIATETVRSAVTRLYRRLDVHNAPSAIHQAYLKGYLRLPDDVITKFYTNTKS